MLTLGKLQVGCIGEEKSNQIFSAIAMPIPPFNLEVTYFFAGVKIPSGEASSLFSMMIGGSCTWVSTISDGKTVTFLSYRMDWKQKGTNLHRDYFGLI